jgi:hypothetical protein
MDSGKTLSAEPWAELSNLPPAVCKALFTFQKIVPPVLKESEAGGGAKKYSYADMATILKTVRPALVEAGLGFTQLIHPMRRGELVVETILFAAETGEQVSFRSSAEIPPTFVRNEAGEIEREFVDPHKYGSIATYLSRYALTKALGIAADEDDDAAKARPLPGAPEPRRENRPAPRREPAPAPAAPKPATGNGRPSTGLTIEEHAFLSNLPEDVKSFCRASNLSAVEALTWTGWPSPRTVDEMREAIRTTRALADSNNDGEKP